MDYTNPPSQISLKRFGEAALGTPKRNMELLRIMLAAALLGAVSAWPCFAAAVEQRVALVIGNSAYPSAPLRNSVNDANAIATTLKTLGFDVTLRTNVNFRDMTRAVSQFGQKITPGSVALFYYAGHGLQVRGKNFLVPVDAEIESEAAVRGESVDVDQVLDQFSSSRLSMVILDACRNNPFERRFRTGQGGGLAQIDAPKGTLIAYATAPGKTAADGAGANGIYTEQLLKAMDAPGTKVEDVFKQVRINVARATQDQQIPWEASSLTGEFYFRVPIEKPVLAAPAAAPAPSVDSGSFEMAFWDSIKTSTNRSDFAAYLEQYPNGRFSPLARNRVKGLEQDTIVAASRTASTAQSEKERAELLKSMEDERRKRDRDAATVKQEMEELRAELLKLSAASTNAPRVSAPSTATPTIGAPNPAGTSSEPPTQVALASPTAGPHATTSSPFIAEWAPRITLLESYRSRLTLSKAIAILLDVNSDKELSLLITREADMKRLTWSSSCAMGTDRKGDLVWGCGVRWERPTYANKSALEYCTKAAGDSCRIVLQNGDFQEKAFLELAKKLGGKTVAAVRETYMRRLSLSFPEPPPPVASRGNMPGVGFSSAQE